MARLSCIEGVNYISTDLRINGEIRAKEVRLVDTDGEQLGIMPLKDALKIAGDKNLDLAEVAPLAKPPVCRVMDYGKFKFEQAKREKEARKNQKIINIKEVKLRPRIDEHDFQVKLKNAVRFLEDGDKVKVTIMFRGREMAHPDLGKALCLRIAEEVKEIAVVEKQPLQEGRNMTMMLGPKR